MAPPIFDAKLHPPVQRRNLTLRPRLYKLLDDGLADQHRLLLVYAPAGYGKTTLIAGWLATVASPAAWLSLEEADADPVQFAMGMTAALQTIYPGFGAAMLRRLQSGAPASAQQAASAQELSAMLAQALVVELSQQPAALLVLDDFHLAASSEVSALVQMLLDRAPTLTIAMTTRVEPALALPRLRVRNQLTEITAHDLRFSAEETTQFLQRTMQINTPSTLGAELAERTEGWAGALQLAALSLRGLTEAEQQTFVTSFSGDHRHIADYLSTEALRHLPDAMRHFLLITAPLQRLCASLCDALLAVAASPVPIDSQAMLETIERRGLFLNALDERRRWYRYHHLFGDLMRSHLQAAHPDLPPLLHHRAAEWHLEAGDADAAMHHALQSGNNAFAADIAQQFGVHMVGGSRLGAFQRWLHALDAREVARRPYVLVGAAWTHVLTGQSDAALREVELAETELAEFVDFYSRVDGRMVTAAEVRGHINAIRSYAARLRGDTDSVIHFARRALEDLPADAFTVRSTVALNLGLLENERGDLDAALKSYAEAYRMGMQDAANLFVGLSARRLEGEVFLQRGQLYEAAACFRDVLSAGATEDPPPPAIGMGYLGLAQIALLRGAPGEAERLLGEGMQLAEEIASAEAMQQAAGFAVEIALYNGNLVQARRHFAALGTLAQADASVNRIGQGIRLALAEGDVTAACAWLDEAVNPLDAQPSTHETRRAALALDLQRARVWLAMGRAADALALLANMEQRAHELEEWQMAITALLLKARSHLARQERAPAWTALQAALQACAGQDAAGLVVMERQGLVDLLASIAAGADAVAEFAARVLTLLPESTPATAQAGLVEPLSERELDVLRLMAIGQPNRAIAETLIIAPSTVKTHVNNILAKLGATNRTEAVAKARAIGVLA
ncbi:MAG: LuxR family transcriptional regulator [Chloroflexota bacterium]|nr:AAA family ATPase [Caldilinea sp.]GIK72549.1 MAG: LuxR family transcriptional regulator [Chloroflexota bacterium]